MQKYPLVLLVTTSQANFNWKLRSVLVFQKPNLFFFLQLLIYTKNTSPSRHFSPSFDENVKKCFPYIFLLMSAPTQYLTNNTAPAREEERGGTCPCTAPGRTRSTPPSDSARAWAGARSPRCNYCELQLQCNCNNHHSFQFSVFYI